MTEVAAIMTICGILASVAIGAVASAPGVSPNPPRNDTLSLTTSSWARRLVVSALPASSLTTSSIFLPATVSPLSCMYSLAPATNCLPVEVNGPVIGTSMPILTVLWAKQGVAMPTTPAINAAVKVRPMVMTFPRILLLQQQNTTGTAGQLVAIPPP